MDDVYAVRVLNVVVSHAREDAWAAGYPSWTNVVVDVTNVGSPGS
jgi:hypothetical protein